MFISLMVLLLELKIQSVSLQILHPPQQVEHSPWWQSRCRTWPTWWNLVLRYIISHAGITIITCEALFRCISCDVFVLQEPYMEGVNPFIKNNKQRMIMFLDELGVNGPTSFFITACICLQLSLRPFTTVSLECS